VDSHVHVNEPGRTAWEGFASATRAAAAGGVTTLVDMPLNSIPPTTTVEALDAKLAAADGKLSVDVAFWGGAVPENLGTLAGLHDAGVRGFKAFLVPSGVDEFGHLDAAELDRALAEVARLGTVLVVHAEDPASLVPTPDGVLGPRYADFLASRPPVSEQRAVARVLEGVRRTGARAHVLHLSDAGALPMLRAAKAEGLPVTVETCPHYLTLRAEDVPDRATQFKCCPPIRDDANRDLLWAAVLDGTIDAVVSDHSPSTPDLKHAHGGDFGLSWGGIAGLQLGLPVVWTAARARGVPLDALLPAFTTGPARVAGLDGLGVVAPGAPAHLVAFAPEQPFVVDARALEHRNPDSPYDGAHLVGVPRTVWLRGEVVVDGARVMRPGTGRTLLPARPRG
jgi:allantoinase